MHLPVFTKLDDMGLGAYERIYRQLQTRDKEAVGSGCKLSAPGTPVSIRPPKAPPEHQDTGPHPWPTPANTHAPQVNLKAPTKTVLVQLIRNGCAVAVVPSYKELAKYNVRKLAEVEEEGQGAKAAAAEAKEGAKAEAKDEGAKEEAKDEGAKEEAKADAE